VLLHQFRNNLVLPLNLVLQSGYGPLLVFPGRRPNLLTGGGSVLEELLLLIVEHQQLNVILVAEIGRRDSFK
jgi:hypothetical protein